MGTFRGKHWHLINDGMLTHCMWWVHAKEMHLNIGLDNTMLGWAMRVRELYFIISNEWAISGHIPGEEDPRTPRIKVGCRVIGKIWSRDLL